MGKPTETGELCGAQTHVCPGGYVECQEPKGHDPDFHCGEYVWSDLDG